MTKEPIHASHEEAIEEHLHLRQLFDELAGVLCKQQVSQSVLLDNLSQLRDELLAHFEHEEVGGYFRDAIQIAPRLKTRADDLLNEHPNLAKSLDSLLGLAESGDPTDSWWNAMTEAFAQFHDEFDQHERGETELIQEAYNRDVGSDD